MTIVKEMLLAVMGVTINVGKTWLLVIALVSAFPSWLEEKDNCVLPFPQPLHFHLGSG